MIVINTIIVQKDVGINMEVNLLKREDATDQEWKLAKMFEAVIEKATDTLAEISGADEITYKKKRID